MSQHWALTWPVKRGSEAKVQELFRESGRPAHVIRDPDGNPCGKLLHTSVFMRENVVVRIIEFEGQFSDVVRHMASQKEVRELERDLEQYLEEPRDLSTPQGARAYFSKVAMQCVLDRRHDD